MFPSPSAHWPHLCADERPSRSRLGAGALNAPLGAREGAAARQGQGACWSSYESASMYRKRHLIVWPPQHYVVLVQALDDIETQTPPRDTSWTNLVLPIARIPSYGRTTTSSTAPVVDANKVPASQASRDETPSIRHEQRELQARRGGVLAQEGSVQARAQYRRRRQFRLLLIRFFSIYARTR